MPEPVHILFTNGLPIAVQTDPFVLPEYGDKMSLKQVMYVPAAQPKDSSDASHQTPEHG